MDAARSKKFAGFLRFPAEYYDPVRQPFIPCLQHESSFWQPLAPACKAKPLRFAIRSALRAFETDLGHVQRARAEHKIASFELKGPVFPNPLPALKEAVVLACMGDDLARGSTDGHSRSFADQEGHGESSTETDAFKCTCVRVRVQGGTERRSAPQTSLSTIPAISIPRDGQAIKRHPKRGPHQPGN